MGESDRRVARHLGVVLLGILAMCLASCSGGGGTPPQVERSGCPYADGQACLGRLPAGLHRSSVLTPPLRYRVPRGWANAQDTPGDLLLAPARSTPAGVNAGTSDYIGVYTSVVMDRSCGSHHPEPLPPRPADYTRWLRHQSALAVSGVRGVTVGGLHGTVQVLRLSPTWHRSCSWSQDGPMLPYLVGVDPSVLVHVVQGHDVIRLYLLSATYFGARVVLAIEAVDTRGPGTLTDLRNVVETFRFGRGL